jgi:hypothetical protein
VNVNSLSALANQAVWFASQDSLNDPFEGVMRIKHPKNDDELLQQALSFAIEHLVTERGITEPDAREVALTRLNADNSNFKSFFSDLAEKSHGEEFNKAKSYGLYSSAADIPNDKRSHIANMKMWSHYGDGLKGFCVKFSAKEFYQSLKELNPNSIFTSAKVDYVSDVYEMDLFSPIKSGQLDYLKALQKKHEVWEEECECRILCNEIGLKRFGRESIESVFIGEKMPENEEHLLINIIERTYPNAKICKISTAKDSYGVHVGTKM